MKLSSKESKILSAVELRADLTIPEIRKLVGLREHTIRYALRQLEERKVISRIPFINLFALGYTSHNIFFSLGSESRKYRQSFIDALIQTPSVVWIAEMGAEFEFGIEIICQHFSEVRTILGKLTQKFGNIFQQKSVSSQFSVTLLSRGYLSETKTKAKPLTMNRGGERVEIDELDHKILVAISSFRNESHRKLAEKLKVPLSTFELRISKLRNAGILTGYFYSVQPSKFDYETFKILVFGRGLNPQFTQKLLACAAQHPNMISVIECFGSWDYEINVEVSRPQQAAQIARELYAEFGDEIISLKVLSKFQDIKTTLYPSDIIIS
jgi:DNA-binding Lrp family transcriptional regulator